jgi:cobalamin synthase
MRPPFPRQKNDIPVCGHTISYDLSGSFPLPVRRAGTKTEALSSSRLLGYCSGSSGNVCPRPRLAVPAIVASTIIIILMLAVSGCFHMDGLADTADGFLSPPEGT